MDGEAEGGLTVAQRLMSSSQLTYGDSRDMGLRTLAPEPPPFQGH